MSDFWDSISGRERLPDRVPKPQGASGQEPPGFQQSHGPLPPAGPQADDGFADAVWAEDASVEDAVVEELPSKPSDEQASGGGPPVSGSRGPGGDRRRRLLIVVATGVLIMLMIALLAGGRNEDSEPMDRPLVATTSTEPPAKAAGSRPRREAARTLPARKPRQSRPARSQPPAKAADGAGPDRNEKSALDRRVEEARRRAEEVRAKLPTDRERARGRKLLRSSIVALRWMDENGQTWSDPEILAKRMERRSGIRTFTDGDVTVDAVKIAYIPTTRTVMLFTAVGAMGIPLTDSFTLKHEPPNQRADAR